MKRHYGDHTPSRKHEQTEMTINLVVPNVDTRASASTGHPYNTKGNRSVHHKGAPSGATHQVIYKPVQVFAFFSRKRKDMTTQKATLVVSLQGAVLGVGAAEFGAAPHRGWVMAGIGYYYCLSGAWRGVFGYRNAWLLICASAHSNRVSGTISLVVRDRGPTAATAGTEKRKSHGLE